MRGPQVLSNRSADWHIAVLGPVFCVYGTHAVLGPCCSCRECGSIGTLPYCHEALGMQPIYSA